MFYPRDLKNKYLACSIADDFGKPFLHKTNPDDFAHFTNPENVFVSMNTYLANKNDFSKYCENYEFVRNQQKYRFDFIIKGFSTAKLPEASLSIVNDFFYAVSCVGNIGHNIQKIQSESCDMLVSKFSKEITKGDASDEHFRRLEKWARFEKPQSQTPVVIAL